MTTTLNPTSALTTSPGSGTDTAEKPEAVAVPMSPTRKTQITITVSFIVVFGVVATALRIGGFGLDYILGLGLYLAFWVGIGGGIIILGIQQP